MFELYAISGEVDTTIPPLATENIADQFKSNCERDITKFASADLIYAFQVSV